jgi:ubiquinone/menaquinone biosynthesis C-methylase UbiE
MSVGLIIVLSVVIGLFVLVSAGVVWRRQKQGPVPFPTWLTPVLDNPYRRWTFSPETAADRHGIAPGMRVLEIGPGGGYMTKAAEEHVGPEGQLICLDIQMNMLRKLRSRLEPPVPRLLCASGSALPLQDGCLDLIYLCEVLGEIPDKGEALREYARVLRDDGTLSITEALPDPDYLRAPTLLRLARDAGFEPTQRFGNWLRYTQRFHKSASPLG